MRTEYQDIIKRLENGSLYLFTVIFGDCAGSKMVLQDGAMHTYQPELQHFWHDVLETVDAGACPCICEVSGAFVFAERLVQEPEMVICGGGHVSLELAALADFLEYPYTIIDDRSEFANPERFLSARLCICEDFSAALQRTFSSNAYYVIVTRGHAHDLVCLELILGGSYGYVGMIGSKGKVQKSLELLRKKGHSQEVLDRVHAPIGLPIASQTPKEVAISIIAELIQTKNQEQADSYLDAEMRELFAKGESMVLARIIDKRGSAPRGIGSRMLVDKNGLLSGSIGGGKIEYEAIKKAKQAVGSGECTIETYRLDSETAGSLGMWCGGEVDVFFECVN